MTPSERATCSEIWRSWCTRLHFSILVSTVLREGNDQESVIHWEHRVSQYYILLWGKIKGLRSVIYRVSAKRACVRCNLRKMSLLVGNFSLTREMVARMRFSHHANCSRDKGVLSLFCVFSSCVPKRACEQMKLISGGYTTRSVWCSPHPTFHCAIIPSRPHSHLPAG